MKLSFWVGGYIVFEVFSKFKLLGSLKSKSPFKF